jgi:ATP-dependent Clp protease ATP-binding subunit ClpC
MPLTEECKRVLNRASEEAEGLGHNFIGSGHILLGLLGEEGCYAAGLLRNHGIELTEVRKEVSESLEPPFERSV